MAEQTIGSTNFFFLAKGFTQDSNHEALIGEDYPLHVVLQTVLEFVLPGDEGIAWWEGLIGLRAV